MATLGPKVFDAPEPAGHCLGPPGATLGIYGRDINMIFEVRNNTWWRCTQEFLCENFQITDIKEGEGQCGHETCKSDEQCFTHFISSKRKTKECVPTEQVWVLS